MNMSRVLIVATTSYAGMGPYVTNIYNSFSPEDEVYFLGREYAEEYFHRNIKKELIPMCTFYYKTNTHWHTLKDLFIPDYKYDNHVIELCKRLNIEVVHYINGLVPKSVFFKLHSIGVKTLGTIHDLHAHETSKKWYKRFRRRIQNRNININFDIADNLITNSPIQYEELIENSPKKDIFFIPFPSLVTQDIANGSEFPDELKDIQKPYILFFGLIDEYKGIDYLIDSFVSTPMLQEKYKLVIAGRGIIKEKWKKEGVIFLNRFIKDSEIKKIYESASCVVYPYISATQSGVLSIAFYFGTPTITSDVPYFKSIVEPNNAGVIFKAKQSEDLKDKLIKILSCDNTNIISAEKEYYRKYYNKENYRQHLIKLYSKL